MKRGIETPSSTIEAERVLELGASDGGKQLQHQAGGYRSGSSELLSLLPQASAAGTKANGGPSVSLLNQVPLNSKGPSSVSNVSETSRHSNSNSSWQSCNNPDEVDVTGKLTGSDLSDSYSHSSSVMSRRSTSSARRKPRFDSHSAGHGASQRQSQQQARAIVQDWK